jgi:hypothetical protein
MRPWLAIVLIVLVVASRIAWMADVWKRKR